MAEEIKLDAEMKVKAADTVCLFSIAEQTRLVRLDQLEEEKRVTLHHQESINNTFVA